jgi:MacB-like periplasmic core domain
MMPDWKPEIRWRLARLQLAPTRENAIVEELAQHLDESYAELLASGVSEADAYRHVRAELHDGELLTHGLQRVERSTNPEPIVLGTNRRTNMIVDLWQDLRFGARMLMKQPGFTLITVLTLALGIGANTAIFSLVDKALIRKLPVEEPERLVVVNASRGPGVSTTSNYPDFVDYRYRNEDFEGLVCYYQRALTLSERGQAERIQGMIVSGNYFTALRVLPALGRGFLPEEDKTPGAHPVVVLSYGLWQRRFGADPGLMGKVVNVNGYPFTVVGIAPPEFTGTIASSPPDVYVPIMMLSQLLPSSNPDLLFGPRSRSSGWLHLLGRLKPGVSREQAAAAMTTLGGQIARAHPNADGSPRVEPKFLIEDGSRGHTNLLRDIRFPLQMLIALLWWAACRAALELRCASRCNALTALPASLSSGQSMRARSAATRHSNKRCSR